jgi:hypothetical protein
LLPYPYPARSPEVPWSLRFRSVKAGALYEQPTMYVKHFDPRRPYFPLGT